MRPRGGCRRTLFGGSATSHLEVRRFPEHPVCLLLSTKDRIMSLNTFLRRGSRPAPHRQPSRRLYRPVVELLETRVVPSGIFPPGTGPTITSLSPGSAVESQAGFIL